MPLWERVFTQIWHQGTLYPATYVALPVWCEVVIKSPDRNHAPLLERIGLIEQSRGRQEKELALVVGQDMVRAYEAALQRLLPVLPEQIKRQEDATPGGLSTIRNLLGLQAFALGKRWAGMLLSRQVEPWIDLESGEPSVALIDAAMMLERDDLPEAIRAGRRKQ
ncbi:hypothetical protein D3875_03525 [Deinococcus cavernae]|uniref:Uncharacterized protein n=1 Tax=Deinococcus cavernae TaxID=2320857 RepID=A0A418VET2_9DEIO|nr:hypothetical protein D3875_03525 [Deinococcus cavernae]